MYVGFSYVVVAESSYAVVIGGIGENAQILYLRSCILSTATRRSA